MNGRPPLGLWGPRDLGSLPKSTTAVDCSDVAATQGDDGESHFSHQYYRLSPRVIPDVVQVLNETPPDKIIGRLRHPKGSFGGRAWWIPFDENAGQKSLREAATAGVSRRRRVGHRSET